MADFKVSFSCDTEEHKVAFGEVNNISDGGYERGYAEAMSETNEVALIQEQLLLRALDELQGKVDPELYEQGYKEGLAARTYETWTITLVDGSIIEKEVALL